MARTLVAFTLVALVVVPTWLRLEEGSFAASEAAVIALLALLPTLAVARRVPGERRRDAIVVVTALLGAALVAGSTAFSLSLADARPFDDDRAFFGPLFSDFGQGFLDFWDTSLPFNRVDFPGMHGVVLLAGFGFTAAAGMAIATRRTFLALALLLVGAGWPATMASTWLESSRPLVTGALILAVALALVVLLRPQARGLPQAAVAGVVLVALAVAGSTSDAVAKQGFVDWDSWDWYDRPHEPVDVRYVWDANYDGISFPQEETTVLKVKVPGPKRSLYWRATTLDDYTGAVWREKPETGDPVSGEGEIDVTADDPLLPAAARARRNWVKQEVKVEALDEQRLVGSAQFVRWQPQSSAAARVTSNGGVVLSEPLHRGQRYTVWSYVPDAKPKELRATGTAYPPAARQFLRLFASPDLPPTLPWGAPGRDAFMRHFFQRESYLADHAPLYRAARRVTADASSPYEAAVLLEAWFRGSEGGFTYDEQPPFVPGNERRPPLVTFLQTKRGYCQHFAGAMALMLRYVGVPARVAAGFTSGTYDDRSKEWSVTDHNAHTWVEVYFPRFGWIPFDPTPDRGQLTARYTPFSGAFDVREAAEVGGALLGVPEIAERVGRASRLGERESGATVGTGEGGGVPSAVAETGRSIVAVVLVLALGGAALIVAVKQARRATRFAARDPRALAAACRRDLVAYVVDQGYEVRASATVREVGDFVAEHFGVQTSAFVSALADARYGPPQAAGARARLARRELRRLRSSMRRALGLGERVRGALSLRSLSV
ncbi:MAG: DUF3488 domain-containing protein [Thermoleophilia bacterium]|nr:DUF3488 domain-containing protein [Thermoleophilia bacterium]